MNHTILTTLAALAITATAFAHGPDSDPPRSTSSAEARAERVIISCRSEALIRGTKVLIRDVAVITAPSEELRARIGDIELARRPALGFNRVFPRGDIRQRLVVAGLSPDRIEMIGAKEVVAQPLATILNPADLTDATDPVLRAVLDVQPEGHDIEFNLLNKPTSLRVPPGRYDLALRAELRDGRLRPSSATVNLEIVIDGEVYKTIQMNYRLRHFVQALRTSRVIKKGEPLGGDNVRFERLEVSPGTNMHLTSLTLVEGMVASRDMQNNYTLRVNDVAKPALIHRGDLVTLVIRRGNVEVTTKALALGSAPLEGRIAVRPLSSTKPMQAVVFGAGIALVRN